MAEILLAGQFMFLKDNKGLFSVAKEDSNQWIHGLSKIS